MSDNAMGQDFIVPKGYAPDAYPLAVGPSDSFMITRKPMVIIVTPWKDHPELISAYEAAVKGAYVAIVDTGSTPENHQLLGQMVNRLSGHLVLESGAFSFAGACNHGFDSLAMYKNDIVMFLNNDISADAGWLDQVARDVAANRDALLGPSTDVRGLAGRAMLYVEGWCIAAHGEVWERLSTPAQGGPWDAATFARPYWEDVDLSFRATCAGVALRRRDWPVRHISNVTSDSLPGAKAETDANRAKLERRVAEYDAARGVARI